MNLLDSVFEGTRELIFNSMPGFDNSALPYNLPLYNGFEPGHYIIPHPEDEDRGIYIMDDGTGDPATGTVIFNVVDVIAAEEEDTVVLCIGPFKVLPATKRMMTFEQLFDMTPKELVDEGCFEFCAVSIYHFNEWLVNLTNHCLYQENPRESFIDIIQTVR